MSWNTAAPLDECLTALPAALAGLEAEVVVVDNRSADDSVAVIRRHPVQLIANDDNVGYARGMNQALAGTEAPVLIALNPDTVPPPGSLRALVERAQASPTAGVIAPRLVHPDGRVQHSVYRFPALSVSLVVAFLPPRLHRGWIGRRWWLEGQAPHDRSGPVDWAIGAVHAIRRDALEGAPPYSERWFMYVEDLDLCWRLHRRGRPTLLAADIDVPHIGNAAGAQAWGATREQRWWAATYDEVEAMRGAAYGRALALVNLLGVVVHLAVAGVGSYLSRARRDHRRAIARRCADILPVHLTAVRSGAGALAEQAGVHPTDQPPA